MSIDDIDLDDDIDADAGFDPDDDLNAPDEPELTLPAAVLAGLQAIAESHAAGCAQIATALAELTDAVHQAAASAAAVATDPRNFHQGPMSPIQAARYDQLAQRRAQRPVRMR